MKHQSWLETLRQASKLPSHQGITAGATSKPLLLVIQLLLGAERLTEEPSPVPSVTEKGEQNDAEGVLVPQKNLNSPNSSV